MNEKNFSETMINSVDMSVKLLKVTLKGSHSVKKKKKKKKSPTVHFVSTTTNRNSSGTNFYTYCA